MRVTTQFARFCTIATVAATLVVPAYPLNPPEPNFPTIGGGAGQIVRLRVTATSDLGQPCTGQLGFRDKLGKAVGPTKQVFLTPGQTASLDLPFASLVSRLGERAEVRAIPPDQAHVCSASIELLDVLTGRTVARTTPSSQHPLAFSRTAIGIGAGQTARLAIGSVDNPDLRCLADVTFSDPDGRVLARAQKVFPAPGQTMFLDLASRGRGELVPAVQSLSPGSPDHCVVSLQIYDSFSGWTVLFVDNPDL